MRTNEIRKYLTNKLSESGIKAYHRDTSNSAKFPYIVFDMNCDFDGASSQYDLEISVWDNNSDKSYIEDLCDTIEDLLDKELNLDDNGLLCFYKQNRGYIDDPNKDLNRIMIKFDMRYYK